MLGAWGRWLAAAPAWALVRFIRALRRALGGGASV